MSPGRGQGLCSPLWPSLRGLGASPGALRRIVQIAPGLPLEEPLIPATPCCAGVHQGHVNPLMLPHAVIFLCTVSYVTMGFPTMHSLVPFGGGGGTNNVLLWQPNMLPARLESGTHFPPRSEFSQLKLFSFPYSHSLYPSPTLTSAPLQSAFCRLKLSSGRKIWTCRQSL